MENLYESKQAVSSCQLTPKIKCFYIYRLIKQMVMFSVMKNFPKSSLKSWISDFDYRIMGGKIVNYEMKHSTCNLNNFY